VAVSQCYRWCVAPLPAAAAAPPKTHLLYNLRGAEVAGQAHAPSEAELAVHGAANLVTVTITVTAYAGRVLVVVACHCSISRTQRELARVWPSLTHLAGHAERDVSARAAPVQHGDEHSLDTAACTPGKPAAAHGHGGQPPQELVRAHCASCSEQRVETRACPLCLATHPPAPGPSVSSNTSFLVPSWAATTSRSSSPPSTLASPSALLAKPAGVGGSHTHGEALALWAQEEPGAPQPPRDVTALTHRC
jgi:hypothetical protein